jgi:hypothetical protein
MDKASLAVYAAILKLKTEYQDSFMAEVFIENLLNQPSTYVVLKTCCEICGKEGCELHHIAGRKHGYHVITVCGECHRELSNYQKLWDRRWWLPDQPDHIRKAFLLQGISEILRLKTRRTGDPVYEKLADCLTEEISKRLRR